MPIVSANVFFLRAAEAAAPYFWLQPTVTGLGAVLGLDVLTLQVTAKVADREDAALVRDVLTPWVDFYQER